jgi:hypothetical protein
MNAVYLLDFPLAFRMDLQEVSIFVLFDISILKKFLKVSDFLKITIC